MIALRQYLLLAYAQHFHIIHCRKAHIQQQIIPKQSGFQRLFHARQIAVYKVFYLFLFSFP